MVSHNSRDLIKISARFSLLIVKCIHYRYTHRYFCGVNKTVFRPTVLYRICMYVCSLWTTMVRSSYVNRFLTGFLSSVFLLPRLAISSILTAITSNLSTYTYTHVTLYSHCIWWFQIGCCGADGPNDYLSLRKPLPTECRDTVTGNAFFYGCADEMTWFLEDKSRWTTNIAISIAALEVTWI